MKKTISILILISLLIMLSSCSTQKEYGKFNYSPDSPKAGEKITVTYKPDNPKLQAADEVEMLVYSFSKSLDNTEQIDLTKKDSLWSGTVTTADSTKGLLVQFKADKVKDNNNELGYVIFFDKKNKAYAGLASLYAKYGGVFELGVARDSIVSYFDRAFEKNPDAKREYIGEYISSIPRKQMDHKKQLAYLEELEKKDDLSQNDLENLSNSYRILGDFAKSQKYFETVKEKYPKSDLLVGQAYQRFRNMLTPKKMLEVFTEFQSANPDHDLNNFMMSSIVRKYQTEKNYDKVDEILNKYKQYIKPTTYNSMAWSMFESKTNLNKAKEFASKGVELARKELKNIEEDRPNYFSKESWQESKDRALSMVLDTYANIQKELGNKDDALNSFAEVVELTKKEDASMNENYFVLLNELGKNDEAKSFAEEIIRKGKSTSKVKELLSGIFSKEGKSEEEFNIYVIELEKVANKKMVQKLKDEMKNDDAPTFELKDVEGNTVKLSDLKGKVVILDFWATWCGPCLQSFPFMQKAVNNYKDNPNVKFLFVNTWERVDDKQKNVEDFLQRTKYPFHILLDNENTVVSAYGVRGIPTKFIIDGNGKIKFMSVGLNGGESEFLHELDLMISLAQGKEI